MIFAPVNWPWRSHISSYSWHRPLTVQQYSWKEKKIFIDAKFRNYNYVLFKFFAKNAQFQLISYNMGVSGAKYWHFVKIMLFRYFSGLFNRAKINFLPNLPRYVQLWTYVELFILHIALKWIKETLVCCILLMQNVFTMKKLF